MRDLFYDMVHKEFIWPYGGREVLLSFSCTGWTDRTPMAPMESSPSVFRAICDLPVGYHRYKFMVDGVWRFDHGKLHAPDDYGGFDNVIHVKEIQSISSRLQGVAFSPRMQIDNICNAQDQASSSGSAHHKPALQLLENETDVCRQRLSVFLSSHNVYELIPDSGKVSVLDVESAVKDAFHVMYKEGFVTMPIWDGTRRRFIGMMTASDFILILIELHNNHVELPNELLDMHTIFAWKRGKAQRYGDTAGAQQLLRPLIQAGPDESLRNVALRLLQNKISTIPIIYSSSEGSCPMLLYMACLGEVLKYLYRHCANNRNYMPLLQKPIGSLPLGPWTTGGGASDQLIALRPNETLFSALNLLIQAQISSVPIVDDKGSLINIYSRSDITSLAEDSAYARIRLDQTILSQAVDLVDRRRYQTCTRSDPFYTVMERLSNPVVRRLFVIEAGSLKVEGVITLTDVFRYILS